MNAAEIRARINAQIIEALEAGVPPWVRPWKMSMAEEGGGRHHNFVNKKRVYRGVNPLILEMRCLERDWACKAWGTFNQWKLFDCHVNKGEKSTMIVLWKPVFDKATEDDEKRRPKTFLLRYFNIFNACQVAGNSADAEKFLERYRRIGPAAAEPIAWPVESAAEEYATARRIVQSAVDNGMVLTHGGNRACWKQGTENVKMPKPDQFPTPSHYYETLFHEMGHWTEQTRLCDWDRKKWGYAMGELRAELTCCYLRQHADIPPGESVANHTAYIKSWLEQMRKDDQWIFKACRFADVATDCLLKMAGLNDQTVEEEREVA
jgi:antirestriction protein ArdC